MVNQEVEIISLSETFNFCHVGLLQAWVLGQFR